MNSTTLPCVNNDLNAHAGAGKIPPVICNPTHAQSITTHLREEGIWMFAKANILAQISSMRTPEYGRSQKVPIKPAKT